MKQETRSKLKISGRVLHGDGYGKVLGFPTANLDRRSFVRRRMNIKLGVYAGKAEIISKRHSNVYQAGIVVGPLDRTGLPKLEVHLLDFRGNLYGQRVQASLNKYLRPFRKFSGEAALKKQIRADMEKVKKYG